MKDDNMLITVIRTSFFHLSVLKGIDLLASSHINTLLTSYSFAGLTP
jgi:hypothetical protein